MQFISLIIWRRRYYWFDYLYPKV